MVNRVTCLRNHYLTWKFWYAEYRTPAHTSSYRLLRRIQLHGNFELAILIQKNCLVFTVFLVANS